MAKSKRDKEKEEEEAAAEARKAEEAKTAEAPKNDTPAKKTGEVVIKYTFSEFAETIQGSDRMLLASMRLKFGTKNMSKEQWAEALQTHAKRTVE